MTGRKPAWAWRLVRRIRLASRPSVRAAARIVVQADTLRDAGRYREAAMLYVEAMVLRPSHVGLHTQAGHMFKEARDFDAADRHYRHAERLKPEDADIQLQLGHFNKTVDRLDDARIHYARARALVPGWAEPDRELADLDRRKVSLDQPGEDLPGIVPIPALLPSAIQPSPLGPIDVVQVHRLGGRQWRTETGMVPLLSGVEAIRGFCFSDRLLVEAILLIDGQAIARQSTVPVETLDPAVTKTVFNLWVDLSVISTGLHQLDLVLADAQGWTRRHVERVAVTAPLRSGKTAPFDSDGQVVVSPDKAFSLEQQVRAAPSVVRAVAGMAMPPPATILVLRTDQLGDMVVSVPALQRLRALFPSARIVGLLTMSNVEFARSLDLFDDIVIAEFPDDPQRRRRTMTAAAQRALAERLAVYDFDVAIDLATSDVSRPLLRLAGARLTFGFDDGASPWLDGGISGRIRDLHDPGEAAPQSGRILALVERLGTLCHTGATVIRRPELDRGRLAALGLAATDRFIVLHAGARVAFSRWSGFPNLARAWLARHPGTIVLLTEGTDVASGLAADLRDNPRLIVIDRRLPFDDLDALASFATIFVGNDSGPKHLASLRGTPVVSIHCARISWAEWGQEQTGVVVSRRVPCAGCAIFHDADECGKDIACITDIRVAEVLAAAEALHAKQESP